MWKDMIHRVNVVEHLLRYMNYYPHSKGIIETYVGSEREL